MKKYISLFSLIALFFVGIQQMQSQDSGKKTLDDGTAKKQKISKLANQEKQQSPDHKAKVSQLETMDANSEAKIQLSEIQVFVTTLSVDQQKALHEMFVEKVKKLNDFDDADNSQKTLDAKAAINEEANLMISKILNEDQMVSYKEYLVKTAKSDR